jgi:hypothetical protein
MSVSKKSRSHSTTSNYTSPQISQALGVKTVKSRRSVDLLDDWGSSKDSGGVSLEVAARLAKRKADQEKESEGKKKRATELDDIPTFLF